MKPTIAPATRHGARLSSGLYDEMIVDNFAGAGGASMGIEAAAGRSVDVAINHDQQSIVMHQLNHPNTRHLCEDVWKVDPLEATAGRPVGLAWFSPDCRHFSRAKGGKPVEKKIRGLAWVVIRWAKLVKPRVIILENVREFQEWGPLTADNRPCPNRKGLTFKKWAGCLRNLGYVVEWKVLNAADYGAPTHRRRLFLVARCDGLPVVWPEPSHGPGRRPYRTAAECINWAIPCPSIFLTKPEARVLGVIRPLADKTMRRIAMGLKRYVLDNPKPFIVTCNHGGPEFRGQSINEPMRTLCAARDAHGVVTPYIAGVGGRAGQSHATAGDAPVGTITAKNDRAVIAPLLVEVQNASSETGHRAVDRPSHTITANPKGGGMALAAPFIAKQYGGDRGNCAGRAIGVDQPTGTITTSDHHSLIMPFLAQRYGEAPHQQTRGQKVDEPLRTITATANCGTVIAPTLLQYNGEKSAGEVRGVPVDNPINTIPTENRFAVIAPHLSQYFGGMVGKPADAPLPTVTAIDHNALVAANLIKMNHGDKQWHGVNEPLKTILAGANHHGVVQTTIAPEALPGFRPGEVRAFLIKYFGSGGQWQECSEPLHTVVSRDRFGLVAVNGQDYQIVDVGLRMLTPRELLNAQFGKYAAGYVLTGTKSQQVAKIGNSVPPQLAEAMVRANFAEKAEVAA